MTAFDPQITKLYAAQKYDELMTLIFRGAKFSAYLLLFLAIPIMINAEYILQLWLGIVPQHTIAFVNLTIIYMLSETISRPLITAKCNWYYSELPNNCRWNFAINFTSIIFSIKIWSTG